MGLSCVVDSVSIAPPEGGGSVLECGQGSDCLCSVAVRVSASDPLALDGDGQLQSHGLLGGLCLASCPDDAAGLEAGGGGENHGRVAMG